MGRVLGMLLVTACAPHHPGEPPAQPGEPPARPAEPPAQPGEPAPCRTVFDADEAAILRDLVAELAGIPGLGSGDTPPALYPSTVSVMPWMRDFPAWAVPDADADAWRAWVAETDACLAPLEPLAPQLPGVELADPELAETRMSVSRVGFTADGTHAFVQYFIAWCDRVPGGMGETEARIAFYERGADGWRLRRAHVIEQGTPDCG